MKYKQEAPFSIQIELTKGCNLQCTFCGINGFQDKPNSNFNFMDKVTANIIATSIKRAGWNSRLEFAMHGEPTMNDEWLGIIEIFNDILPKHQIMVTTNGGGIVDRDINDTICDYFEAGGDILAIDEYVKINFVKKIRKELDVFRLDDMGIEVYEYPEDKEGNPHRRVNKKFLTFIAPIDITKKGVHATLSNHCGSGGELDISMDNALCAKPFREMAINWDATINLCCNDFIGEYVCGNILENKIEDIWNSKYFDSARKFLMNRHRSGLRPCRGCTAKSYRVGLLPDKFGKVELPKPTRKDTLITLEAQEWGPQRKPTARAIKNIVPSLTKEEKDNWDV